ncbi:hypothetical protein DLAC_00752 [Tieghemostelium lacteum]|uniref:CUE domain-containing protein n=1 Tax=Tieghemostelium lacteum TaxID=361077 RepID=A0A152A764_TIELA|nr:hypothetical protein DLAC_00752 [Tieghemostelium lacteum]|eukprot:KYR01961.1 hypothetical protein DLAC_00752 [Tieghemostelium lacteum]
MINPNEMEQQEEQQQQQQSTTTEDKKDNDMSDSVVNSSSGNADSGLTFPTLPSGGGAPFKMAMSGISFPSIPTKPGSTASTSPTSNTVFTSGNGTAPTRFNPYVGANNTTHLSFKERFDIVEVVVSMFPLLKDDSMVYTLLNKSNWVVEQCINDLQKRHDMLERKQKNKDEMIKNLLPSSMKDDDSGDKDYEFEDEEDLIEELNEDIEDEVDEDELLDSSIEDNPKLTMKPSTLNTSEDSSMMTDISSHPTQPTTKPIKMGFGSVDMTLSPGQGGNSALSFSRYPKLKEDIQTLRDIFGTTYHDFELKSFYIACGGNLEVVIDQLVNDQIRNSANIKGVANNGAGLVSNVNGNTVTEQPVSEPRKPITERLSEEEKRTIQLQLIEEQEKLEKKFSDKKKNDTKNHPTKKTFTQPEIVKELKDLFGSTVDEGVIEWVAYRCDYDLGSSVTQLVDLKHNSLLKKGSLEPPKVDQATQMNIQKNLDVLGKQNLASVGINIDNFAEEMSKKLQANDSTDSLKPIPTNNNNNLFFNNPNNNTTTTTTTTTSTLTNFNMNPLSPLQSPTNLPSNTVKNTSSPPTISFPSSFSYSSNSTDKPK